MPDEHLIIRDRRGNNRYFVDNIFIREWGGKLGPYAIAVYNVLVMHANADTQKAFPSYKTIAKLAGMSRRQAIRECLKLAEHNIISISETSHVSEDGKKSYESNIFTLLSPIVWGKNDEYTNPSDSQSPPPVTEDTQGSDSQSPRVVTHSHPNNTNSNKTNLTTPKGIGDKSPPAKTKAKKPKKGRPKTIPAFRVFTETTGYYGITKHWREKMGSAVGGEPEDLEFWRKVIVGWTGCGWFKGNVQGMLEFFGRREIPSTMPSKNGAHHEANSRHRKKYKTGHDLEKEPTFDPKTGRIIPPGGT